MTGRPVKMYCDLQTATATCSRIFLFFNPTTNKTMTKSTVNLKQRDMDMDMDISTIGSFLYNTSKFEYMYLIHVVLII